MVGRGETETGFWSIRQLLTLIVVVLSLSRQVTASSSSSPGFLIITFFFFANSIMMMMKMLFAAWYRLHLSFSLSDILFLPFSFSLALSGSLCVFVCVCVRVRALSCDLIDWAQTMERPSEASRMNERYSTQVENHQRCVTFCHFIFEFLFPCLHRRRRYFSLIVPLWPSSIINHLYRTLLLLDRSALFYDWLWFWPSVTMDCFVIVSYDFSLSASSMKRCWPNAIWKITLYLKKKLVTLCVLFVFQIFVLNDPKSGC